MKDRWKRLVDQINSDMEKAFMEAWSSLKRQSQCVHAVLTLPGTSPWHSKSPRAEPNRDGPFAGCTETEHLASSSSSTDEPCYK